MLGKVQRAGRRGVFRELMDRASPSPDRPNPIKARLRPFVNFITQAGVGHFISAHLIDGSRLNSVVESPNLGPS